MPRADLPLALTLGDPAGIGPDVTLQAYEQRVRDEIPPFVLVGDATVLADRAETIGLPLSLATVEAAEDALQVFSEALPILPVPISGAVTAGHPSVEAMEGVKRAIETAAGLVQEGEARAIVTNPVSKAHLYQAGFEFPGHTEYLAALASTEASLHPVMMLVAGPFKVVPTTIHIPLNDVARCLTPKLLLETLRITHRDLRRFFGYTSPRLAVSGLNPHAGENGSLGREEVGIIVPTIEAARAEGIDANGPYPADTLFHAAAREGYDAAICMYHDQALVPFKTLAFEEGVNVTLGLPFVRTSPDHGTAFDIAGTGEANPRSLIEALRLAGAMSYTAADEAEV
jgi:4-hydroxythreonine-4-phosphate dehydrogenase